MLYHILKSQNQYELTSTLFSRAAFTMLRLKLLRSFFTSSKNFACVKEVEESSGYNQYCIMQKQKVCKALLFKNLTTLLQIQDRIKLIASNQSKFYTSMPEPVYISLFYLCFVSCELLFCNLNFRKRKSTKSRNSLPYGVS